MRAVRSMLIPDRERYLVGVAHGELMAGRAVFGNFLAAQAENTTLVVQQLVKKHQLVLHFNRKSGALLAVAFDDDQFFQVFLAFRITPQAGDCLDHTREGLNGGRLTGSLALQQFIVAKYLLRQVRIHNSVINCHICYNAIRLICLNRLY